MKNQTSQPTLLATKTAREVRIMGLDPEVLAWGLLAALGLFATLTRLA
jgi:hypothetical protein